MIMLPIILFFNSSTTLIVAAYVFNIIIHAFVDNLKANALRINLVTDQLIHILQIIFTWLVFVII